MKVLGITQTLLYIKDDTVVQHIFLLGNRLNRLMKQLNLINKWVLNPTKRVQVYFMSYKTQDTKTTRIKGAKMVITNIACIDIEFGWFWLIV